MPRRAHPQHVQRRSVLAGCASIVAFGGCLDVRSVGDDSADAPDDAVDGSDEEFYESGTVEVTVDGEAVDLTADRFQAEHADEDVRFHLHEGDELWHMERERVTFATAIDLLPRFAYAREGGAHVVTVDGTTYDGREPGTEIAFRVDGGSVDPTRYEVQDGDHLVVAVTTGG